jgi:hypothetical protein
MLPRNLQAGDSSGGAVLIPQETVAITFPDKGIYEQFGISNSSFWQDVSSGFALELVEALCCHFDEIQFNNPHPF